MGRSKYLVCRPMFGRNRKLNHGEIVTVDQIKDLSYCIQKRFIEIVDERDKSGVESDDQKIIDETNETDIEDQPEIHDQQDDNPAESESAKEGQCENPETADMCCYLRLFYVTAELIAIVAIVSNAIHQW